MERACMKEQIALEPIQRDTCIVKGTHRTKGRTTSVEPGKTAARNLHYGRIIIEAGDTPIVFENADHETGLVCLNGRATISTGDESFELGRYDSIYIPRDSNIRVSANDRCDLAEI